MEFISCHFQPKSELATSAYWINNEKIGTAVMRHATLTFSFRLLQRNFFCRFRNNATDFIQDFLPGHVDSVLYKYEFFQCL